MKHIPLRMVILTWMAFVTGAAHAQQRTSITLFNVDQTKDNNARVRVFRARDEQIVNIDLVTQGVRIAGRDGAYDVGVLPAIDELWVKINQDAEMAPIRRTNGQWDKEIPITKSAVVAQRPPANRIGLTCVLRGYAECPAGNGICRKGVWQWIPSDRVVLTPVRIPTQMLDAPCQTCYSDDEQFTAGSQRTTQSRVVAKSLAGATQRPAGNASQR